MPPILHPRRDHRPVLEGHPGVVEGARVGGAAEGGGEIGVLDAGRAPRRQCDERRPQEVRRPIAREMLDFTPAEPIRLNRNLFIGNIKSEVSSIFAYVSIN